MKQKNQTFIESYFTNEDGNLKRLPRKIAYDRIQLDDYHWKTDDMPNLVYASYPDNADLKEFTTTIYSDKPDLLCSMLTLHDRIDPQAFDKLNKNFYYFQPVSDDVINRIIRWCRSNGFPFMSNLPDSRQTIGPKKLFNIQTPKQLHFDVLKFLRELDKLYRLFLLYQAKTGDWNLRQSKEDIIFSITDYNKQRCVHAHTKDIGQLNDTAFQNIFSIECAERHYISQITFGKNLYDSEINLKAENLFDAAFYQLVALLGETKSELRICPLCKMYFKPVHGRQKYCHYTNKNNDPTCYPQKAYKRKSSKHKKAAE